MSNFDVRKKEILKHELNMIKSLSRWKQYDISLKKLNVNKVLTISFTRKNLLDDEQFYNYSKNISTVTNLKLSQINEFNKRYGY